ncbi:hypothetical protein Pmani_002342 [Petrolisthes manimaculis]|uniref:Uncharacterized protein n=1 Tax=Petrolisthes manimaculis TaxID=1843537 RepID=A0AAE1QKN7_9EUCA|nr:hypothetical protein Pmani_002342 [Petrolisthes manimaculis]
MAEYTVNSTEDNLLTNEFLSWSGDFDVDYNAIKLIAEFLDEDPQLTMVEQQRVVQKTVEEPVSHQLIQPIVPSHVFYFEQLVSSHHEKQPDSQQFSASEYQITEKTPMFVNDNVSNTMEVVAQANPQRRGRKPKNTTGRVCSPSRQPKTKVYEMEPFVDKEAERKRLNASLSLLCSYRLILYIVVAVSVFDGFGRQAER